MNYTHIRDCWLALDDAKSLKEMTVEVASLNGNTPSGRIQDADTVLADVMEEADFEESGMFEELRRLYYDAYMDTDESKVGLEIFHKMFNLFTGISFAEYLDRCKECITKK